jgi:hypothetical protein
MEDSLRKSEVFKVRTYRIFEVLSSDGSETSSSFELQREK